MFIPAIVLVATTLSDGALPMTLGLAGAGIWTLSAWLLREGLQAEAEFLSRKVARRPAIPRKIFAAIGVGIGVVFVIARTGRHGQRGHEEGSEPQGTQGTHESPHKGRGVGCNLPSSSDGGTPHFGDKM